MDHRRILEEQVLTRLYMVWSSADDNTRYQEMFQKITGEISYFVKFVPKLKLNKELDKRCKDAIKAAAVYHSDKNIIKLWSKEKYNKGFYTYAQILSDLENGTKLRKDASSVKKFLTELMKSQFKNILSEKAFFLWNPEDCKKLNKKLKYSLKAALALTYMELVDPAGMESEMKELRDQLVICSAIISTIHRYRWKISGFVNFISDRLPTIKLGLEPEEYDSFTVMYLNKFWCENDDLKEDFCLKSKIRLRIQTCLKQHLPRQNISTESMDGRRRGGNAAYTAYCHYFGLDKTLTPFQMKNETGKNNRFNRHEAYHKDAEDLYELENVRTDYGFDVNVKGDLTKNGTPVSHKDFLTFLQQWTLSRIQDLKSLLTETHRDMDEDKEIDRLTLAFRSVFGRYCFEMSIKNDKDIQDARNTWKNHTDVITAFSLLVAVFDELFHLQHGEKTCGIKKCIANKLSTKAEVLHNRGPLVRFVHQLVGR